MTTHTLDLANWRLLFPAFANNADTQIQMCWDTATSYIFENDNFALCDDRLQLALNLMTAHCLFVFNKQSIGETSAPITSASEGSVSAGFSPPPFKNGFQYWLSTSPYGLQLWALLKTAIAGGFYIGGKPETLAFRDVGGTF